MGHSTGSHTKFHHRYHIVWSPKYRYKVLHGEVRCKRSILPTFRL
jgi:putative transposase